MAEQQIIMDGPAIAKALDGLADGVAAAATESMVLIGIREGGDVLAARLGERLEQRGRNVSSVGALDITLYRDDFGHRSHWPSVRSSEVHEALDDRTVVLVDDVLFTGRTVRAALEALLAWGRPARVLLAVLVDRGHRQLPIQPDFVGHRLDLPRDALCLARFVEQGAAVDQIVLTEAGHA